MLFKQKFLDGIRSGEVTLAFRRWRRPTVRAGGSLMTGVGELQINAVSPVTLDSITATDARHAGYQSLAGLLVDLQRSKQGEFYRIELGALHADPRIALRDTPANGEELDKLHQKMQRLDRYAGDSPWAVQVLQILKSKPGVRAGDLCQLLDQEKMQFKRNVRKLKNLGLTVSLGTGYCLSKRGLALLEDISKQRQ